MAFLGVSCSLVEAFYILVTLQSDPPHIADAKIHPKVRFACFRRSQK